MKREFVLLLLLSLTATGGRAAAATRSWDGGSTSNSNWQTAANWEGDIAPVAGDDLVFNTSTRSPSNNDYASGTTFNTLTMGLGGHIISGNGIALNAGLSFTGGLVNLASLKLNFSQTFSAGSGQGGSFTSAIDTNGQTLTIDGAGTLAFNGPITGSGNIVKNGSGRMDLGGTTANSFSGGTTVNDGLVQLNKTLFLDAVPGNLIIGDGVGAANSAVVRLLQGEQIRGSIAINIDGQFDLNGRAEYITNLTMTGGNVAIGSGELGVFTTLTATAGTISNDTGLLILGANFTINPSPTATVITGAVSLNGATRTFNIARAGDAFEPGLRINGAIRDGGITKTGAGLLRLQGANTYSGATTVSAGDLWVEGEQPQSAVTVDSGGTLSGVGTVGPLTVNGGVVAPNLGSFLRELNVQGNVQFSADSTYRFTKAPQAPVDDGRLAVAGAVNLGGCTLELVEVLAPSGFLPGFTTRLIINDGTDPVVGTFAGLPEGSRIDQFGKTFFLSYRGGDGNDVTLYMQATRTWDGGGADDKWTTKENWAGDVAPQPGDILVFPQDAARKSNTNDFPAGTVFDSIQFSGSGYSITGAAVGLRSGITDSTTDGTNNVVDFNITLVSDQTFTSVNRIRRPQVRGTLALNDVMLSFAGRGEFWISGPVTGSGSIMLQSADDPDVYFFGNGAAFTGTITVNSGRLTMSGAMPNSPTAVGGGVLRGSGSVGPLSVSTGFIQPTVTTNAIRPLQIKGGANLGSGVFRVDVFRNPSPINNQLAVEGTVNLASSRLEVDSFFSFQPPQIGDTFVLISNDGTDAVIGEFVGQPEGSEFTVGFSSEKRTFRISYIGGDGNDVVITRVEPTPTPTPTATATASGSPAPTPGGSATPTPTPGGGGGPTALGNIATRLRVETGDNVLIGGFIVTGTEPKKVMLRAIGPSLSFDGALANPQLQIFDGEGEPFGANDNWPDAANVEEIVASTIPPTHHLESAFVASFAPGSYTAVVSGVDGGTGIGLVELYDLDRAASSKLANIATRGVVQTGADVMIGGMIVLGDQPQRVIIRAIGPSLGIEGNLLDPVLELYDSEGNLVQANDDWRTDQQADIEATTIPPTSDRESAIVRSLQAGAYTAIVRGAGETTGIAVVEVYALP